MLKQDYLYETFGHEGQGSSDSRGTFQHPFKHTSYQLVPGILPKIPNKNVVDIEDTVDTYDTAVERKRLVNCHRRKLKNCCDVLFTKFIIAYNCCSLNRDLHFQFTSGNVILDTQIHDFLTSRRNIS